MKKLKFRLINKKVINECVAVVIVLKISAESY